ncbi:MAG: hypothetical protein KDC84_03100 [Crocinitomicaceae bacterium]|nr:hypothetical protein [Crocinitomicaceae bacterium]
MKKKITAAKAMRTMAVLTLATTMGVATSCKKEGCTDSTANNYDEKAKTDDNTCTYDYITGEITANTTWSGDVQIKGKVTVVDGVTLTIMPGTVIKAHPGTGASATVLLVARGGKLMADGTASLPIIFTALSDNITSVNVAAGNYASPNLSPTNSGLWGGLVICGKAEGSFAAGTEEQVEGIPTSDPNGLYGGSDNTDNSGSITYVSVRHSGIELSPGNEIQGLTLGAVGSGTTVSYIEIVGNNDDGIEWFGGTVDVSNVVIWNVMDDGLDTDKGYSGTVSNFFILGAIGGSAFELDGPEGTPLTTGNHSFINGTVNHSSIADHLLDVDGPSKTTNVDMSNIYFNSIDNSLNRVADYAVWSADMGGTMSNFQYTFVDSVTNMLKEDTIFMDMPNSITTSVAAGTNTVGGTASAFGWTWASQDGAL